MKTCPVCQRPFADEKVVVCPADGAELLNISRRLDLDETWRFTPSRKERSAKTKKVEKSKSTDKSFDPVRKP